MVELPLKPYSTTYHTFSHIGKRPQNEDRILVKNNDKSQGLFLIADGMGGCSYGGEAAQIAVDSIAELIFQHPIFPDIGIIREVMNETSKRIRGIHDEAGATVGGILMGEERAIMFWLGDVRIYVLKSSGELTISNDHSLIGRLKKEQVVISPEAIRKYSNVVTGYLGMGQEIQAMGYHEFAIEDETRGLICSDGIHQNVNPELIQSLLKADLRPSQFNQEILNMGIADNNSYLSIHIRDPL